MKYEEKISSHEWKYCPPRRTGRKSKKFRCRGCHAPATRGCTLELHDPEQNRLNERAGDRTPLCRDCHRMLAEGLPGFRTMDGAGSRIAAGSHNDG
jgi:hypothetical protein